MRALADEGRYAEALGRYAALREVMLEELGTEPSATSRSLYADLLQGSRTAGSAAGGRAELTMLLRLLRQALEAVPGVRVPELDADLTALAVRVLSAA
jgi:DNA-binding SARP family transcriptional activator